MKTGKDNLRELLAEARAIHLAMKYGALSYERATVMTKPYLEVINEKIRRMARQYRTRPKEISFQDLGRSL